MTAQQDLWWRDAVLYQVYIRSFADSDGDGMGDMPGITSRLDHVAALGCDGIWVNPFYPSGDADAGYDVADYRDVDPRMGTLADADALIARCKELGLRVLFDIVPNHTSNLHELFVAALAEPVPSAEGVAEGTRHAEGAWAKYHLLRGRGANGEFPPNDWESVFGGAAWTEAHPGTGWWYLHLFDSGQPDVDWSNPDIHAEFEKTMRFWFDRGVDGLRIDVAHSLVKEAGYPDLGISLEAVDEQRRRRMRLPFFDQPEVHDIWREWRSVADSYDPPKMLCGEAFVESPEALSAYVRPDELHTCFNFDFFAADFDAVDVRQVVYASLTANGSVGAPTVWVTESHDDLRTVTRYAPVGPDQVPDLEAGRRRARAMLLLQLALPGAAYLFQGQELGLEEVLDLADDVRQDPTFRRTKGERLGRDGVRVPVPWTSDGPTLGFGPDDGAPAWLPQPAHWRELAVAVQERDPVSSLQLTKQALSLRHSEASLGDGVMHWDSAESEWVAGRDNVLSFVRPGVDGGPAVRCLTVFGGAPVEFPADADVLLCSGSPGAPESTTWLRA